MGNHVRPAVAVIVMGLFVAVVGGCSNSGGTKPSASEPAAASRPAAAGSPSAPSQSVSAPGTVATASTPLGTILVDGKGRTLYLFAADTTSRSNCSGACAKEWPPLIVSGEPVAGKGLKAGLLGTTKRDDGSRQVTYNGHPLYYFADDRVAGDTKGQGVNDSGAKWYVLDPSGNRITGVAGSPKPGAARPTGGGY
ncbi:hypothetical protein ACIRP2_29090 [Streptomyces sp. NPDC101194]|uniref:COG4315 family predicted lipoprotein n=1 Tax=Streptomyces sp. NPDC101194 TaxID=3366127 RepID=UPI00382A6A03